MGAPTLGKRTPGLTTKTVIQDQRQLQQKRDDMQESSSAIAMKSKIAIVWYNSLWESTNSWDELPSRPRCRTEGDARRATGSCVCHLRRLRDSISFGTESLLGSPIRD